MVFPLLSFKITKTKKTMTTFPYDLQPDLQKILALSDYCERIIQRHPEFLISLYENGELAKAKENAVYQKEVKNIIAVIDNEKSLAKQLRLYRQREMLRIIWRHLLHKSTYAQTVSELSCFADAIIQHSLLWLSQAYTNFYHLTEMPPELIIVALGKLGAHELNLSSDIDIMFVAPADTLAVIKSSVDQNEITYQQFYEKVAQRFTALLHENTEDGFVFRVDLRLRPYGNSGPLVMGLEALENYYSEQGRDWERYALIKARAVTGDKKHQQEFEELIRPFIYRRYIDFGAIKALREMHQLIQQEVRAHDLFDDIKRGPGGIREVEFLVQAFQLIRGGREVDLRERNLLKVIKTLTERKFLNEVVSQQLIEGYIFLRNTEHCLQAFRDQQTHRLPNNDADKERLATVMGFSTWQAFNETLSYHRTKIDEEFTFFSAVPSAS